MLSSHLGHLPNITCSAACANEYISLYDECGPDMEVLFPTIPQRAPRPSWSAFDATCRSTVNDQGVSTSRPYTVTCGRSLTCRCLSTGSCVDSLSWRPNDGGASGCSNLYDASYGAGQCDLLISSGHTCAVDFAPGGPFAGYCDLSCHLCTGALSGILTRDSGGRILFLLRKRTDCGVAAVTPAGQSVCPAMFGPSGSERCICDHYGGIRNCPVSCQGYCSVEDTGTVQTIVVDGADARGSIVEAVCDAHSGRHEWFKFTAVSGFVVSNCAAPRRLTRATARASFCSTRAMCMRSALACLWREDSEALIYIYTQTMTSRVSLHRHPRGTVKPPAMVPRLCIAGASIGRARPRVTTLCVSKLSAVGLGVLLCGSISMDRSTMSLPQRAWPPCCGRWRTRFTIPSTL